jgi:hypothetical protein
LVRWGTGKNGADQGFTCELNTPVLSKTRKTGWFSIQNSKFGKNQNPAGFLVYQLVFQFIDRFSLKIKI